MKTRTFRGGVHPEYAKQRTAGKPIQMLSAPSVVVIPLQQHIGAPADALVKKGDDILVGQMIAKSSHAISSAIHSPVSGKVMAVEPRPHIIGRSVMAIVVENDEQNRASTISGHPDPIQLSREDIVKRVAEAGICGMGGAGFPTHVKIRPPKDAPIDFLLVNGAECEPYLTADHRLMVEHPGDIVLGAKLLAKASGARRVFIAIEENKPDAIQALQEHGGSNHIEIVALDTKYPQGGERQLVQAVLQREVPRNGLPYQAGVVVQNVGTAWATTKAVRDGRPSIERVVTVTGPGVIEPGDFMVSIGTPFEKLIEAAGGFTGDPGKVICGGPMMGLAQVDLGVPVIKGVSGILVFDKANCPQFDPMPCIKCARCVDVCPASLLPLRIEAFGMNAMWDEAADYGAMDCIECGCCTYICPSKRHLLHWIRLAKNQIVAAQRRQTG